MLDFVRVACAVPAVRVGDTKKNASDICDFLKKADQQKVDLLVFPEMALTGYTCQDLFFQEALYEGVKQGLREILDASAACPAVTAVVGLPARMGDRMFNCAAVISGGEVRGIVPKSSIPNYNEFYEKRWFASGDDLTRDAFDIGSLLGGTSVVEVIFSYPGLGNLAVSAITSCDYNLIQGYVLWMSLIYMVINLIVDASYICIDPRMRLKE